MYACLSHAPNWEPGPQPRHVAWLGFDPVMLLFADLHSIHWATLDRAKSIVFNSYKLLHSCCTLLPWPVLNELVFWFRMLLCQIEIVYDSICAVNYNTEHLFLDIYIYIFFSLGCLVFLPTKGKTQLAFKEGKNDFFLILWTFFSWLLGVWLYYWTPVLSIY